MRSGALVGLLLVFACTSEPTGVLLTVQTDADLDQLRIGPSTADATLPTMVTPEVPEPLDSTEVVPLFFADALAGQRVDLLVHGVAGGTIQTFGSATTTLIAGQLVPVSVSLSVPCGNGSLDMVEQCDDRNRDDGDGCDANCRLEEGYVCQGVPSRCRLGCPDGCPEGEHCEDDVCVCDPAACAGCCSLDRCVQGTSPGECGAGGGRCQACELGDECVAGACEACADCTCGDAPCDPLVADTCVEETCQCGDGPACGEGEACRGGECVCAGDRCRQMDGTCHVSSLDACGPAGGLCAACDERSDRCSGGCRCGDGPPCGEGENCVEGSCQCGEVAGCTLGQRCDGIRCVCDEATCDGCCQAGRCLPGDQKNACGGGGIACENCRGRQRCTAGACVSNVG